MSKDSSLVSYRAVTPTPSCNVAPALPFHLSSPSPGLGSTENYVSGVASCASWFHLIWGTCNIRGTVPWILIKVSSCLLRGSKFLKNCNTRMKVKVPWEGQSMLSAKGRNVAVKKKCVAFELLWKTRGFGCAGKWQEGLPRQKEQHAHGKMKCMSQKHQRAKCVSRREYEKIDED